LVVNGKLGQVRELLQILRLHAGGVELPAVVRHVVVGVLERPFKALQLQGGDLVAAGFLDGIEFAGLRHFRCHGVSSFDALPE
jgi:hypothetical protein